MAVSSFDKEHLSQSDQNKIANLTNQAQSGAISWDSAHAQAEAIRNQSGYSGGADGAGYFRVGDDTGGFGDAPVSWGGRGGSGGGSKKSSDYTEYLKDLYAQNLEAQLAGLKSAYDQNVSALQAEAEAIPKRYYAARNETAAQSELEKQAFNEAAAASGLNTGTAGQAALSRSATLQGNLSSIAEEEQNALSENQRQQQDLEIAYQNAVAQAKASGNAQLAQALYNESIRQEEADLAAKQLAQEQANWQTQWDYSVAQDRQKQAYNLASSMLALGLMPDADTLSAAGISDAMAQALIQANAPQAEAPAGTSPRKSPVKTDDPELDLLQDTPDAVGLLVERSNLPDYATILNNSEAGVYGPQYGRVLRNVQAMARTANGEDISKYLTKQLELGGINELGVATVLQALGLDR